MSLPHRSPADQDREQAMTERAHQDERVQREASDRIADYHDHGFPVTPTKGDGLQEGAMTFNPPIRGWRLVWEHGQQPRSERSEG